MTADTTALASTQGASAAGSKAAEKPPFRALYSIYLAVMCDAIALTIAQPFIPDMCRNQFQPRISEEYVGLFAGLLVGGQSMAQFVSSTFLGHWSDVYGRKPLILVGLFFGSLCTFFFGASQYFALALAIRLLGGLTNALTPITKAVVSDVTHGEHRTLAFAYLGGTFMLARTLSSAVSGLTTGVIIPVPLLDNPYMLPSLIGAAVNALGFVATLIFVPETGVRGDTKNKKKHSLIEGVREIAADRLQRKLIFVFCVNTFGNGGVLLLLVLYFSLDISDFGLGFTPFSNGIAFTWFGIIGFLFQVVIFKRVLARLTLVRCYLMGTMLLSLGAFLTPFLGLIYWAFGKSPVTEAVVWLALSVCCTLLAVGFMTALPLVSTMQTNAAVSDRAGLLQGTAQSLANLVRSMGPILCGALFSASVAMRFPALLFWLMAALYFVCFFICKRLSPDELERCTVEQSQRVAKLGDFQIMEEGRAHGRAKGDDEMELLSMAHDADADESDESDALQPGAQGGGSSEPSYVAESRALRASLSALEDPAGGGGGALRLPPQRQDGDLSRVAAALRT